MTTAKIDEIVAEHENETSSQLLGSFKLYSICLRNCKNPTESLGLHQISLMSKKHFNKLKQISPQLLTMNTIEEIDMSLQAAANELAIGKL